MTELNEAQALALQAYAQERGRTWKSQLLNDWMAGRVEGELQQVRNTFGPRWLLKYRPNKAE